MERSPDFFRPGAARTSRDATTKSLRLAVAGSLAAALSAGNCALPTDGLLFGDNNNGGEGGIAGAGGVLVGGTGGNPEGGTGGIGGHTTGGGGTGGSPEGGTGGIGGHTTGGGGTGGSPEGGGGTGGIAGAGGEAGNGGMAGAGGGCSGAELTFDQMPGYEVGITQTSCPGTEIFSTLGNGAFESGPITVCLPSGHVYKMVGQSKDAGDNNSFEFSITDDAMVTLAEYTTYASADPIGNAEALSTCSASSGLASCTDAAGSDARYKCTGVPAPSDGFRFNIEP